MFPYADSHKTAKLPIITITLLIINVLVFIAEMTAPSFEQFVWDYSFIPATFSVFDLTTWPQVFSAAFMHGSYSHIIFNMLFLWVFGDNVEERLGIVGYLIFYFGAIIAATLLQYAVDPYSTIPNLGASGAIAGILGFYLIAFPSHRIKTLIVGGYGIFTTEFPAQIYLIYWGVTQVFSGVGSLAAHDSGGVAWFAHIGGFVFGLLAGFLAKAQGTRNMYSQFDA